MSAKEFKAITAKPQGVVRAEERRFRDRAAGFVMGRRVIEESGPRHNAAEREAAVEWVLPCSPRFYRYDVIRGLTALADWAELTGETLPGERVLDVMG
jgi:hypothetical protein